MADFDAETLAEQAVLIGLLTREQVRESRESAVDGTIESLRKEFVRKQMLTSWQVDKLMKGETGGFFFGGCKVLFHIAEGTFARVYRGLKVPGNQSVAIKVLRQRFVSDPEAIQRFNKEAEAGMALVHPNIVRMYDYGEQDRKYYMIMEYVEGSNLRDFLKIRKRVAASAAMPLIIDLAKGLQYSLSQGVTHRDIKGTNILISSKGTAKLVDFGLATIEGDDKKMAVAHGQRTVDYSALERTCGSPKGDPRSDIFFMGCVYYQMLTGQLPLPEVESKDPLAKMLKRSFGAIKPLREQRQPPPPELSEIVEKMMMMDLKKRYQTMDEVVKDLEAVRESVMASVEESSHSSPKMAVHKPKAQPEPQAQAPPEARPTSKAKVLEVPDEDDEFDLDPFEVKAVVHKTVLCVEFQGEIQDAFRKTLSRMGYRVLLVGDAQRGAELYQDLRPDAVLFDCDGLGPDSIDSIVAMHEKAGEQGRELIALILLGPRQADFEERLPEEDRLMVLTKPIKMKDVQEAIGMLLPID